MTGRERPGRLRRRALSTGLLFGVLAVAPVPEAANAQPEGRLDLRVFLKGRSEKPLANFDLVLSTERDRLAAIVVREEQSVRTDSAGRASLSLAVGSYRIASHEPVEFEGSVFSWRLDFEVFDQLTTSVELSNKNATVRPAPTGLEQGHRCEEVFRRNGFGPEFQQCLRAEGLSPTSETFGPESDGALVATIQVTLNRLGFNAGNVDGQFGAATARALQFYQFVKGLSLSGVPDSETVSQLKADLKRFSELPFPHPGTAALLETTPEYQSLARLPIAELAQGLRSFEDRPPPAGEVPLRAVVTPPVPVVRPAPPAPQRARSCIPRSQCCRVCSNGKACGASCISRSYTCRKGKGCACNSWEIC